MILNAKDFSLGQTAMFHIIADFVNYLFQIT